MKISITTRNVPFSSLAIGSFFTWHGENFQKSAEWVDNNEDNVLCLDAKRGSRFGSNDMVTPIQGKLEYVDGVLTFQRTNIVTFKDINENDTFVSIGYLYCKRPVVKDHNDLTVSNAYCFDTNTLSVFTDSTIVEPRTVHISVE